MYEDEIVDDLKETLEEITKSTMEWKDMPIEKEMAKAEAEPETHELLAEGISELLGGEDGPMGAELGWFLDPKHNYKDEALRTRFGGKLAQHIYRMSIEEIDHLDFFISAVIEMGHPRLWWFYDSIDRARLSLHISNRLQELDQEEDRELEDDKLMMEAMKRRKDK